MLRPRPRLPAGPRTPKRTTSVQPQAALDDTANDDQLPSSDLSSSSVPLFSSPIALHPDVDLQREPPLPTLTTNESFPLDLSHSDASRAIHSPSLTHPPPEDDHFPPQPTPAPATSRPATPTPLLSPSSETGPPLRKPSQATVSSSITPLTVPAVQMEFLPEPLPYKHLTLDAAHWTLTSTELQHLVSSAIRQSAKEQLIRLLPPSIIDIRMPEDSAHIERSWDTAAARWRFEAHRRNMLLRALSASGADNDLLTQLSVILSNLDLHAQSLLHAATHRAQLASARDTHRASALAVALRKLNASYARRTRDLDRARAHIAVLRDEVYEAWKHAEEQAAKVDKFKVGATTVAAEPQEFSDIDPEEYVADDDNLYEDDTSSNVLHDVSGAEVVDVTGKAVAAQARLTMMRMDRHPSPRPPPSSYSTRSLSSPMISGSSTPQGQKSASHTSSSRKRTRRKSKASLRPSMPISVRSRSSTRGESGIRNARSKSRSKKGKEPAQAERTVPWIPSEVEGSFLEMEGRPAGGGQVGSDGEGHDDVDGSVGEERLADSSETGACANTPLCLSSTNCSMLSLSPFIAETIPNSPLSNPTSVPESQAPPAPTTNISQPPVSLSPLGDDISLAAVAPSTSASAPEYTSRRSSSSLPSTSPVSSAASTLLIPLESESHHQPQSPPSHSNDAHVVEKIARGKVDLIPDPASIFPASASSKSTATTTVSAPDLSRRGYSLELTSPNASINGSGTKSLNGGSKIRRSISEFLHFGASSRSRHQSVPLPFKSCSGATSSGTPASVMRQNLREVSRGEGGLENGWEDVREDLA
jgi:hypothetical protein